MSPAVRLCSILTIALLALTGCGSDGSEDVTTTKDSSGTQTIEVTFKGDTVDPEGAKVKVEAGEPLKLHIMADKPGEIHVHSDPEQELEYDEGTSTVEIEPIEQPGCLEIEIVGHVHGSFALLDRAAVGRWRKSRPSMGVSSSAEPRVSAVPLARWNVA